MQSCGWICCRPAQVRDHNELLVQDNGVHDANAIQSIPSADGVRSVVVPRGSRRDTIYQPPNVFQLVTGTAGVMQQILQENQGGPIAFDAPIEVDEEDNYVQEGGHVFVNGVDGAKQTAEKTISTTTLSPGASIDHLQDGMEADAVRPRVAMRLLSRTGDNVEWLSFEERILVGRLREILAKDLAEVPAFPELTGDIRLLRFIRKYARPLPRAHTVDMDAAKRSGAHRRKSPRRSPSVKLSDLEPRLQQVAKKYRAMLKWRRENQVDEVRQEIVSRDMTVKQIYEEKQGNLVCEFCPTEMAWGVGKNPRGETRLVNIEVPGTWNTKGAVGALRKGKLTVDEFVRFWIYIVEFLSIQLDTLSRQDGRLAYICEIVDLKGLHMGQLSPAFFSSLLSPWVSFMQAHYPDFQGEIVMINAPGVFKAMWKVFSALNLIDEFTMKKFIGLSGEIKDLRGWWNKLEVVPLDHTRTLRFAPAEIMEEDDLNLTV
ncbi:unnamed protein product [Vitrella brassicaformis CCMP3155]|uniref:CRAL-TRIO domain-containing protein n=2 Tax=Vitrella brassicaformis TaxID=1169539 RepID=A0A0G4F424_VITBC|nr:unnamed protein product [Vitrella brassicaformis CCMP3155]|eukprot:CEM06466.1 unnamed protein product [Vitrella brassicaformis CCMP3155]